MWSARQTSCSVLVFGQSRIEIWKDSEDEVTIDVTRYAGGDNWVKNTRITRIERVRP